MDINKNDYLSLTDVILLTAHGTTDSSKAINKHLSYEEMKISEDKAHREVIELLKQGKYIASGLKSSIKKKPIHEKWQSQQYCIPQKERVTISQQDWETVHVKKDNWGEKWVRTPSCQYTRVFIPTSQYEKIHNCKINYHDSQEENFNTNNKASYAPPYLLLMLEAIEHFNISENNQPLIDILIEWFESKNIEGKKISNNEAKKLASFVRLPSSQKGGNRPWNTSS